MGSLDAKRKLLLIMGAIGLVAAVVCAGVLVSGALEATRGRIFLMGSLFIVSFGCMAISFVFKKQAAELEQEIRAAQYERPQAPADPDETPLPQNAPNPVPADPDEVPLPQNAPNPVPADPDEVPLPQNAPKDGE